MTPAQIAEMIAHHAKDRDETKMLAPVRALLALADLVVASDQKGALRAAVAPLLDSTYHSTALARLCEVAVEYRGPQSSWATTDALRFFAIEYAAAYLRYVGDNPDLARGGSVAAFLENLAQEIKPK